MTKLWEWICPICKEKVQQLSNGTKEPLCCSNCKTFLFISVKEVVRLKK